LNDSLLTNSQFEYLKDNMPPSLGAVAFGIVAIVAVFYGDVPKLWLIGWAVCATLILLFRVWVYLYLKRTPDERLNPIHAKKLIVFSATATGISWGAASLICAMHTDDVMLWVFLAFFMSGYASGAVFSTSALLPACAGYFFPTIIPITAWFFLQDAPHAHWMGMLLSVFTIAAWKMAKNAHSFLIDRVEKQIALRETSQKLELYQSKTDALQTMAGGIAHDFNNLFAGMVSSLYLMEQEVLSPKGKKCFGMLRKNLEQGSQLSTKMLEYSRASVYNNDSIVLNRLLRERCEQLSVAFPGVDISLNMSDEKLIISGDKKQLSAVIDALLYNACESYADESGKVMVALDKLARSAEKQDNGVHKHSGEFVRVEILDLGCGMSGGVQEKIFDPFFSTKFTGRGLGMSVVFGVVKRMGGEINIQSETDQGTRVTLCLPACRA